MGRVVRSGGGGVQRLVTAIKGITEVQEKVGFFESAKYPDGTPVAYVAAIQEFGYAEGGIPPRSFMRTTIAEHNEEWAGLMAKGAKAVAKGTYTGLQVMDAIGQRAAGDVRKKISEIKDPPLAASTVAARRRGMADKKTTGSLTKPLVHTGILINSVTNTTEPKAS